MKEELQLKRKVYNKVQSLSVDTHTHTLYTFRMVYGDTRDVAEKAVKAAGYRMTGWSQVCNVIHEEDRQLSLWPTCH